MPAGVDSPHQLSSDELSVFMDSGSSYDSLQPPWDFLRGVMVVKGSSLRCHIHVILPKVHSPSTLLSPMEDRDSTVFAMQS